MAKGLTAVAGLAVILLFLLVEGAFASPFLRGEPMATPLQGETVTRVSPSAAARSIVLPPTESWPGLVVVDFRGPCDTMYVLRLARPLNRPLNLGLLLASLRGGSVPEDLDAKIDLRGYLLPLAIPTAILGPMTEEQGLALYSVFPGGHGDHLHHGEGAVLAGTFWPQGTPAPWARWYLVESTVATVITGGQLVPFEIRFVLSQVDGM